VSVQPKSCQVAHKGPFRRRELLGELGRVFGDTKVDRQFLLLETEFVGTSFIGVSSGGGGLLAATGLGVVASGAVG